MASVTVDIYSEKAIVVRGALEHHASVLSGMSGTFNERLKGGRGWIFPKYMMSQVRGVVEKLNSGQYGNEFEKKVEKVDGVEMVSKQEYLSLLSRVERLEALFSLHKDLIISCGNSTGQAASISIQKEPEDLQVDFEEDVEVSIPRVEVSEPQEIKKLTKPFKPKPKIVFDDDSEIVDGDNGPEVITKRVPLKKPVKK